MAKKKLSAEAQAIISAADAGLHATTVALVEKFLLDHPDNPRGWLDLGLSLANLGRYESAEHAYLKVIELSDESPAPIYGQIGNLYRAQGDFAAAISWYEKQIAADPTDATGHLFLGNILIRQGKFESAQHAFELALKCDHVCLEEVHFSLGLVNRSLGQLPEAKAHFEKALQLDEKLPEAKTALKDVKTAMGLSIS